ncbi:MULTISPECIES: hypothetical protein [unclassified Mesotoga]|uniref:hypothetical protein n=1 Tax=unclassified Mesotoga TaxID=1184398 RepID=UPI000CCC110A|nr:MULTISPECIES: hypothetical protein [unclassified Mesotoga]PNS42611.1 hypothetical protein RJ60_00760 [Mesotoga sp. B105.6.4]
MRKLAYITVMLILLIALTACPPINKKPSASDVRITGDTVSGQKVKGEYTFLDPEQEPEGASEYKWYRSDKADGTGLESIPLATKREYLLTSQDAGKFMYFEVIPVDIKGKAGDPVKSAASTIVVAGPSFEIIDTTLNRNSLGSFVVKANNLGEINAFEVVFEFDTEYLTCPGIVQSLVGGLIIIKQPSESVIHVAVAGLKDLDVQNTELLRVFVNVLDKAGNTEILFSEYVSEGNVKFSTGVIPEISGLDLSDTGIITIQ